MNEQQPRAPTGEPLHFANILLAGPCNQRCPHCIGRRLPPAVNRSNLERFPLLGLEALVAQARRHGITRIILTGTNTDPQLYRYEARLIDWLRRHLRGVHISLHTNGQLALNKIDVLNMYDSVTLSFPAFDPALFGRLTGTRHMPDLAAILRMAQVPIKVSCLLSDENASQILPFLERCHALGVRRLVFRQVYGADHRIDLPMDLVPAGAFCGNPVYDYHGMQVTDWCFERTTGSALNLFADGTIGAGYLLTELGGKRHLPKQSF